MNVASADVAARAVSRQEAAPSERSRTQSAPPPAATPEAPPAPAHSGGRWVAVVTPETTAVIIALVSKHGVLATVPAVLPQSAKQAIPSFEVLS